MSRRPSPHLRAISPIVIDGAGSSDAAASTTVADDTPSTSDCAYSTATGNSGRDPYLSQIHNYFSGRLAALYESRSFDAENVLHTFETEFVSVKTNEPLSCVIAESGYKCSICVGMPRNPVTLRDCGHIGCNRCFIDCLNLSRASDTRPPGFQPCPICRRPFAKEDLIPLSCWPFFAQQLWSLNTVKCVGCDFSGTTTDVTRHERYTCKKRSVKCPACVFVGACDDVLKHVIQCKSLMVYCIGCGYPVLYTDWKIHSCSKIQVLRERFPREFTLHKGANGYVAAACSVSCEMWRDEHFIDLKMGPMTKKARSNAAPESRRPSPVRSSPPAPTLVFLNQVDYENVLDQQEERGGDEAP